LFKNPVFSEGDGMSQYYSQPPYPPEQAPEADYEYDENDYEYQEDAPASGSGGLLNYLLAFVGGGCLIFICISCCALLAAGAWTLGGTLSPTPAPGSDIGLSSDDPADMRDAVVNEQNVRLTVQEVNRNVKLPAVPAVQGRELVAVTVSLENTGSAEVKYSERDFLLLNRMGDAYKSLPGSTIIDQPLDKGSIRSEEGVEGRLVFEVLAGEPELTLSWNGNGSNVNPRFIALQ
jgi:hypothetical protein